MSPIESFAPQAFLSALAAPGRAADIAETDDVYGWLVGSWSLQVLHYRGYDLRSEQLTGEVHAGWVLEGRAIQDVWIMPVRENRRAGRMARDPLNDMYGSTLRVGPGIAGVAHCVEQPGARPSRNANWAAYR